MDNILEKLGDMLGIAINTADEFGNWVMTAIGQYAMMAAVKSGAVLVASLIVMTLAIVATKKLAKKAVEIDQMPHKDPFAYQLGTVCTATIALLALIPVTIAASSMICWIVAPDAMMLSHLIDMVKN